MARNYQRCGIRRFGAQLLISGDLDPVYVALLNANLPAAQLSRWLVAYWCFYHSGFASAASERRRGDFWAFMEEAARNKTETPVGGRWPRGTERRHFRGEAARKALYGLRKRYGDRPEDMVDYVATGRSSVRAVIRRAETHDGFGPWIAFKVADMVDALIRPVEQDDLSLFLYHTPRQSILEHYERGIIRTKLRDEEDRLEFAMDWLQRSFESYTIPHKRNTSPPDWFALETVWCKHLSHMHGHYEFNKDIDEIRHGLEPWVTHSPTARKFLRGMPERWSVA